MCERWIRVSSEPSGEGGIEFVVENAGRFGNGDLWAVIGKSPSEISALQKRIAAREQSEIDKLVVGEYCNVGQVARQNDCRSIKAEAYHTAKVV